MKHFVFLEFLVTLDFLSFLVTKDGSPLYKGLPGDTHQRKTLKTCPLIVNELFSWLLGVSKGVPYSSFLEVIRWNHFISYYPYVHYFSYNLCGFYLFLFRRRGLNRDGSSSNLFWTSSFVSSCPTSEWSLGLYYIRFVSSEVLRPKRDVLPLV